MDVKGLMIALNEAQNAADKMRHFRHAEFVDKLNGLWTALKDFDQETLENAASEKTALLLEIESLTRQKDEAAASLASLGETLKAKSAAGLADLQAQADALKSQLADEQTRQIADHQANIANLQSTVAGLESQKSDLEASRRSLEKAVNALKKNFQQINDSLNG